MKRAISRPKLLEIVPENGGSGYTSPGVAPVVRIWRPVERGLRCRRPDLGSTERWYRPWVVYGLLADVVVAVHAAFVCFVVGGGVAVWRWPRVAWIHLPAVVWAVGIEWLGAVCPLTPWENWLRGRAGQTGYEGDFLMQWLEPLLYPRGLTRTVQVTLGVLALAINVVVYAWVLHRRRGSCV